MDEKTRKKLVLSNGDEVYVEKFALGKYAKLLSLIEKIPQAVLDIDTMDTSTILKAIPQIVSEASDFVFKILALATSTEPSKWDNTYDLVDAVNVVEAFLVVNDFEQVKKAISRVSIMFKKNPQEIKRIGSKE